MTIQRLGWVLAAGMAGVMFAGGFQGKTDKVGVVDVQDMFQNSDVTHTKQDQFKAMGDTRADILQFLHTYRTITADQAQRFRTLSLKTELTPAEKTELDKIKSDVIATDQTFKALQTKASPNADEVAKLQAFNTQAQQTDDISQRWAKEFDDEMQQQQNTLRDEVLDKIQASVQEVGKKQSYTLIFNKAIVPYADNDVTPDALKVLNAKK